MSTIRHARGPYVGPDGQTGQTLWIHGAGGKRVKETWCTHGGMFWWTNDPEAQELSILLSGTLNESDNDSTPGTEQEINMFS